MSTTPPLRVFVVDDEAPARKKIVRFLNQDSDVVIVGEASNGQEAVRGIQNTKPDLLFLDIQMPGMDGFDVLRELGSQSVPTIVFVTAHDRYAIEALDVHAFGYLLKPFDLVRFNKVLDDAKRQFSKELDNKIPAELKLLLADMQKQHQQPVRFLVQQDERAFFVGAAKIDWVESEKNYLRLHVGEKTYTLRGTLDRIEEKLDPSQFVRLNRSCLTRIDFIRELQSWFHGEYKVVLHSGVTQTWTRRYLNRHPELLKKL